MTKELKTYLLQNESIKMKVSNASAAIITLEVKDKNGEWTDIVLGFDTLRDYIENNSTGFGSVIGRNCNRIKNATFQLNGETYLLDKNDGENNLHSGFHGFHLTAWDVASHTADEIVLSLDSPDKSQGFPGNMKALVTYKIEGNQLSMKYQGTTDKDTIFNPTNHTYFNLNGHDQGTILNHRLTLPCHYFMPGASDLVPMGHREKVTPAMDFTEGAIISDKFDLTDVQMKTAAGYDHHFVYDTIGDVTEVYSPTTGIQLTMTSDMPGVQFYSGNFLDGDVGKGGVSYPQHGGLCLETQYCPNAINNLENEASPVLKKDETKIYETLWQFSAVK